MTDLVFTRWPVDAAPACTSGTFGQVYTTADGSPYQHRGIDLAVPVGTPVYAPAGGIVTAPYNDGSFGIAVCIDHPGTPWYSLYAHLSRADVAVGDVVQAGDQLGLSGATGRVTGPHVHWQVCRDLSFPADIGRSTDPAAFLHLGEPVAESEPDPAPPASDLETPSNADLNRYVVRRFAIIQVGADLIRRAADPSAAVVDAAYADLAAKGMVPPHG